MVVLADGRILKTDGKPIKDVTGYDLNSLFTGSEGTLGLVTEALLRLVAKPRFARTALAEFVSLADASRTVNAILLAGILPAALELMDQTALVCIEEALHLGLNTDVEASIIIETDGADDATVLREIGTASLVL
jgi:glycolate oxidase